MSTATLTHSAAESRTTIQDRSGLRLGAFCAVSLALLYWLFANAELRTAGSLSFQMNWQVLVRLAVLAACGVYGLLSLPRTLPRFFGFPTVLLVGFVYWCAVTVLIAVDRRYSIATLGAFVCLVVFVPALIDSLGSAATLRFVVALSTLFLLGCWITYYGFPELGRDQYYDEADHLAVERLAGLAHPNRVGRLAAACAGLAAVAWLRGIASWRTMLPSLVLALASAWASGSRTALVVALAATALPVARRMGRAPTTLIISLFLPVLLIAASLYWEDAARAAARSGRASEIYELNGRLPLWKAAFQEFQHTPVCGVGYGCQRFVVEPLGFEWAVEPHNLWLNVLLGCGAVGLLLFVALMFALGMQFLLRPNDMSDVILLVILLDGISSSCLFGAIPNSMTFMWLMAIFWRDFDLSPPLAANATTSSPSEGAECDD
ncbi:MAG: O-antigen ligase family protein [Planctomycetales bacterium]|nr:O-antigen ligase family protein [Planctomycetales bacterium]